MLYLGATWVGSEHSLLELRVTPADSNKVGALLLQEQEQELPFYSVESLFTVKFRKPNTLNQMMFISDNNGLVKCLDAL